MSHSDISHSGMGERLLGALKSNPEGILLLAAGCALLLRSGRSKSASSSSTTYAATGGSGQGWSGEQHQADRNGGNWKVGEQVSRATESARQYASNLSDTVTETASSYAGQARSTVQETVGRMAQDYPWSVALAGLAAGAAVGAAFPASGMERRTLGPAGERLADAATKVGEQLKEATVKAGEQIRTAAQERGVGGIKDVASEVADTFEKTFSGKQSEDDVRSASGKSGETSSGATAGRSAGASGPGQSAEPYSSSAGTGTGASQPYQSTKDTGQPTSTNPGQSRGKRGGK